MSDDQKASDTQPTNMNVYGYCVLYRTDETSKWMVDQCDEYLNLPAHYPFIGEALDRAEFLRERNIACRVAALVAEKSDTPEEFERSKIDG